MKALLYLALTVFLPTAVCMAGGDANITVSTDFRSNTSTSSKDNKKYTLRLRESSSDSKGYTFEIFTALPDLPSPERLGRASGGAEAMEQLTAIIVKADEWANKAKEINAQPFLKAIPLKITETPNTIYNFRWEAEWARLEISPNKHLAPEAYLSHEDIIAWRKLLETDSKPLLKTLSERIAIKKKESEQFN